jgi:hypothetical protein
MRPRIWLRAEVVSSRSTESGDDGAVMGMC